MASFALCHLTVDVGLLPLGAGALAFAAFVQAPQSLALPLCGAALAFVRALLSFVGRLFTFVCDPVALIGDPVSSVRLKLASFELTLALGEGVFALIERVIPASQFLGRLGAVVCGHSSP